jgi:TRAP transporter T-component
MNDSIRVAFAVAALSLTACSPQKMALNRMASALADSSAVYETDNDPDFVRLAAPSTLKTVEMLLSQDPNHQGLLLTACRGFTEYSYAFLHVESELRTGDPAAAQDLRARAGQMYERARGYCLRGLQLRHPSMTLAALQNDPSGTLPGATKEDVPWLYWTGTSWGADIAVSPLQLARVAELAPVRALLQRAKALDDAWDHGAIYETLIALDGLPPLVGGNPTAARADFDKALELSNGQSVFARVAYAATLSNQTEKRRLLQQAMAVDVSKSPTRRLTNLIAQRYAKALLNGAR